MKHSLASVEILFKLKSWGWAQGVLILFLMIFESELSPVQDMISQVRLWLRPCLVENFPSCSRLEYLEGYLTTPLTGAMCIYLFKTLLHG